MVEPHVANVAVAGSSPVSRPFFYPGADEIIVCIGFGSGCAFNLWRNWRRGQAAKAKVCKTFIPRFESGRRLSRNCSFLWLWSLTCLKEPEGLGVVSPGWWNGRHRRLKISRGLALCRFKSGSRHSTMELTIFRSLEIIR